MECAVALQSVDEAWKFAGSKNGSGSRSLSGGSCSRTGNPFFWKERLSHSISSATTTTTATASDLKMQDCMANGKESVKCSSSSSLSLSTFSRRCSKLVKEQWARFYIIRRCVTMLVCWKDYA